MDQPTVEQAAPAESNWRLWAQVWFWPAFVAAAVLALDQATKFWAVAQLSKGAIAILPGFLYFDLAYNTGAAFSILDSQPTLLTVLALTVSALVIYFLLRTPPRDWITALAFALVLGGALGNLIDRFRIQMVVDFIRVHFAIINWSWPTFNIADSAICIGIGLLIYTLFFTREGMEPETGEKEQDA